MCGGPGGFPYDGPGPYGMGGGPSGPGGAVIILPNPRHVLQGSVSRKKCVTPLPLHLPHKMPPIRGSPGSTRIP